MKDKGEDLELFNFFQSTIPQQQVTQEKGRTGGRKRRKEVIVCENRWEKAPSVQGIALAVGSGFVSC